MPQRQRVTWAQLRVGTMTIVSLTILATGIFFISGQVGLSRRYTVKTYLSNAGGLREGAQVRLAGVAVGNVHAIQISLYPEPSRAVEIVMKVSRSYQDRIRSDSIASVETVGLLGESYVDITRGSSNAGILPNGGELKSSEEGDIKRVVQNANDVIINLRTLSAKLNDISGQIEAGNGTVGKLISDPTLYNRLNKTTETLDGLITRVEKGEGTLGKLMASDALYNTTVATIDRLNKSLDEMQHGQGSLAKFLHDPSVYDNANHLLTQADSLLEGINQGHGTLGKLATSSEAYDRMNLTFDQLNKITSRMAEGQGTLGKLSTDDTLYRNLNETSQSMKDFLREFKKSPKKYLTLRVRIF